MKSIRNQKNSLFSFSGIAAAVFILLFFSNVFAQPFILKSVDGSWLPMVAQSWTAKNGGVLVKVADGVKLYELRKEMLSKIPDLSIEILGNELFFPTTTINSLFESLKNIDLNVSETTAKRQTASGNSDMFVKKSGEISDKDEYIEASVENVAFDEKHERIVVSVKIQQRAKGGAFAKLYGKYRIEHLYKMKNGVVDPSNAENMAYLPLIFLKNGSRILFVPEKNESRVLTIKPDFKIK